MKLGDHRTQKELLDRAFKMFSGFWGDEHVVLASTLVNLGIAYLDPGDHEKAKEVLERALKIQEQHHDQDHFQLANLVTRPR